VCREIVNALKVLLEIFDGRHHMDKVRRESGGKITINRKAIGNVGVYWIHLFRDRYWWLAVAITVKKFRVPY
jgi:hypothetical protein